jgi:AAA domain
MELVFLHGPPGVGKLTVSRELQRLTGFRLFHNHLTVDMVGAVFDFHSEPFAQLREEFWLRVMTRAAQEGLPGLIFTFVFEPTVAPGFFDRLKTAVEAVGGVVRPVELRCDAEENARRVVQPDRAAFTKEQDPEFLRGSLARGDYAPPADLEGNLVIDTTDLSAAETARQIVERLGMGS